MSIIALASGAIAAAVTVVAVSAFVVVTMAVFLIDDQRGQTHKKRVFVSGLVIDICRPENERVDEDRCVSDPQRPCEAFLSCKTSSNYSTVLFDADCAHIARRPSSGNRVVARYEGSTSQMGLQDPVHCAERDLDLEAQSLKPKREKRDIKDMRSHTLSCASLFVEVPVSPPPSYSYARNSPLVL